MNNDPQESTTKYGTTIDAVFSRYLENIKFQTYVSYFSYHKPIVSIRYKEIPNSSLTGNESATAKRQKLSSDKCQSSGGLTFSVIHLFFCLIIEISKIISL